MSKYDKFGDYLDSQNESFTISFEKLEEIIGEKLPDSAYNYPAWWSNNDSHPLMELALSKNWNSENLNLEKQEIDFFKTDMKEKTESELLQFVKGGWTTFTNYQPVIIKELLESGSENNYSVPIKQIDDKIKILNFRRDNFNIASYKTSAYPALDKFVKNENDVITLDSNSFETNEIAEIIELCDKEIAKQHVKKIFRDENDVYFIQAGKDSIWLDEFKKSKKVGVDYGEVAKFDLSGMDKEKIQGITGGKKGTELENIAQIKEGDIVAITQGSKQGIESFAIITSPYFFDSDSKTYPHKVNVEILNFGTKKINSNGIKGIIKSTSEKDKILEFLRGSETQYFLLRHSQKKFKVKQTWIDEIGRKYHVGRLKDGRMGHNVQKLLDAKIGTKAVWWSDAIDGYPYILGHGTVKSFETLTADKDWNVVFHDFVMFEGDKDTGTIGKKVSGSILEQIQALEKEGNLNWQHSINTIPKKLYQEIIGDESMTNEGQHKLKFDDPEVKKILEVFKHTRNVILYGPPGTGKTWMTDGIKEHLLKANEDPKIALFFPSKPNSKKGEKTNEDKINRIQKDISQKGYELWGISNIMEGKIRQEDFPIIGYLGENQKIFAIAKISEIIKTDDLIGDEKKYWEELSFKDVLKIEDVEFCPQFEDNILNRWEKEEKLDSLYVSNFAYVEELTGNNFRFVTFHPSFSYEDFLEGIRPVTKNEGRTNEAIGYKRQDGIFKEICDSARQSTKKYLLIIDEINRGNVSKIFGELITLIEDDKRGKRFQIDLAYSKEPFSVPKNLYILGTMNTADKSLVQIDTALRRRFAFVEMMPNSDLPKIKNKNIEGISLKNLMDKLNEKIRAEYRDKQIGHSYFLGISDLKTLHYTFIYKIIPLLQDYLYGDYDDLHKILGDKFISKTEKTVLKKIIDDPNELKESILSWLGTKGEKETNTENESTE